MAIEQIDSIIPKSIHAWGESFEKNYRRRYVIHNWRRIIGDDFAKHVKAVGIEYKTLLLYAPDATWRNDAYCLKEDIIQKTNNLAGEKIVGDVRFVLRKPSFSEQNGADSKNDFDFLRELRGINLSADEMRNIDKLCENVGDDELKTGLRRLVQNCRKLNGLRLKRKWHKCGTCGDLCPPYEKICSRCGEKSKNETLKKIREYLSHNPWARPAEVNEYVKCTPRMVNHERAIMVQRLAAKMNINDRHGMKAKELVMLYRCMPPEELDDDKVKETLYRLRFDLAKTEEFFSPRRYDYVSRGKNKGKR